MVLRLLRRRQIVDNVSAVGFDLWHLLDVVVSPIVVRNSANPEVFQNFAGICRVSDIFIGRRCIRTGIFEQELFATRVILLVIRYIVDMIPNDLR